MATIKAQFNPIFKPVHDSRHRYVVMKGSAGSGKSVDTAQQYLLRLLKDKGRNLLCVRKAEVTNRHSTFSELRSAVNRMGLGEYWKATLSPLSLKCINGNEVIFRGVNDDSQREKLKSITVENGNLTDVWIEEGTELAQTDFEIIDDRLRGELPGGQFYQIKLTFNPVSAMHWIKGYFFDRKDPDVLTHHSTYLDNRFIDEAYNRRMMRRKELDPDGYKIYGLGEWGELGGLILSNWEVKELDQNLEHYDTITLGQDFGFNHANALLLLGFKDDDIYILKELYVHEMDTGEIILLAGDFPKNRDMWCDSAEPDRIKTWQKAGYRAHPVEKEKGCVNAQIDFLKKRRIYIDESCVNTFKEIQQWKWKKDEKTGLYIDEPVAFMDDAMAALRYGVEGQRKVRRVAIHSKKEWGIN